MQNSPRRGSNTLMDDDWQPRLLVAEDSATRRTQLRKLFEGRGLQVQLARHGEAALEILLAWLDAPHQSLPDLVVSDIHMPELDGLGLVQAIKQHDGLKQVPVILYTASARDLAGERAGYEQARDLLRGAVDYDDLPETVERQLRGLRTLRRMARVRELLAPR